MGIVKESKGKRKEGGRQGGNEARGKKKKKKSHSLLGINSLFLCWKIARLPAAIQQTCCSSNWSAMEWAIGPYGNCPLLPQALQGSAKCTFPQWLFKEGVSNCQTYNLRFSMQIPTKPPNQQKRKSHSFPRAPNSWRVVSRLEELKWLELFCRWGRTSYLILWSTSMETNNYIHCMSTWQPGQSNICCRFIFYKVKGQKTFCQHTQSIVFLDV